MAIGLNDDSSVGRCGRFKPTAGNRGIGLNTCWANGVALFTLGKKARLIGEPSIGADARIRVVHNSWTGRTIELETDGNNQTIELRTTLPGPLFIARGDVWRFDWAVGSSGTECEPLPSGKTFRTDNRSPKPPRLFLVRHPETPYIIATSHPIEQLSTDSVEHWTLRFAQPGARIMITPLLDIADAPRTDAAAQRWLELVDSPPVRIAETYSVNGDDVVIRATAIALDGKPATLCPLPPIAALCGSANGFQTIPTGDVLLNGILGPYSVVRGSSYERRLSVAWMRATIEPTRAAKGSLTPLPDELAYAGDQSWDEKTPMDVMLSHRIWAPLADSLPADIWAEIKRRAPLPTADAFRASLTELIEPANGKRWLKDADIFGSYLQASYDSDWYNGLTLAGLSRAATCSDKSFASDARALANAVRPERAGLLAYYEIYSDWALDAAWTDPRGELLDPDCAHNGLDGMIGEANLRDAEGDTGGGDECRYLAARAATAFLALMDLGVRHFRYGFFISKPEFKHWTPADENDCFGIRRLNERTESLLVSSASKAPVLPAPNCPEICALFKQHGRLDAFKRLADRWKMSHPERYSDWLAFYVGADSAKAIRAGANDMGLAQEKREQAAVFYHVAHDIALRLFVLGESPDSVEALFQMPLPLAEQLLCRRGYRLVP